MINHSGCLQLTVLVILLFLTNYSKSFFVPVFGTGTGGLRQKLPLLLRLQKQTTDSYLTFSGLKINKNVSISLLNQKITVPTAVQVAALPVIAQGKSCIVHASTGTGKTLCYTLPLVQRLDKMNSLGHRALIIVPSKDLACQVIKDIKDLCGNGFYASDCTQRADCPIVVDTPAEMWSALEEGFLNNSFLQNIRMLILDEVDYILPVCGKYTTKEQKQEKKGEFNPMIALIHRIAAAQQKKVFRRPQKTGKEAVRDSKQLQVVACSATVGRPLRRELCRLLAAAIGDPLRSEPFPIIRGAATGSAAAVSTRQEQDMLLDIEVPDRRNSDAAILAESRKVGLPGNLQHVAIVEPKENANLRIKLTHVKSIWEELTHVKTGMLIVPRSSDVSASLPLLEAWGVSGAMTLAQYYQYQQEIPAAGAASAARRIVVLPAQSSRGLHIPGVGSVFMLKPPHSMDQYLHCAGRAGRGCFDQSLTVPYQSTAITDNISSAVQLPRQHRWWCRTTSTNNASTSVLNCHASATTGEVIVARVHTIVTPRELRLIRSWQRPLGITFNVYTNSNE